MSKYTHDKTGKELYHAVETVKVDFLELYKDDPEVWTPSKEDIACEVQLQGIGDWEPLSFTIDPNEWEENYGNLVDYYTPFQPKKDTLNDRESVLIYGLEGDHPSRPTGLDQIRRELGRMPMEEEFKYPTEAHAKLTCMHHIFNYFGEFGRTFLISMNTGGFYPFHRDFPFITRNTIRLIGFLGDSTDQLEWTVAGQKQQFSPNTLYYVNTMKRHKLNSWKPHSHMIVMNVPKTWENVLKLMSVLKD